MTEPHGGIAGCRTGVALHIRELHHAGILASEGCVVRISIWQPHENPATHVFCQQFQLGLLDSCCLPRVFIPKPQHVVGTQKRNVPRGARFQARRAVRSSISAAHRCLRERP